MNRSASYFKLKVLTRFRGTISPAGRHDQTDSVGDPGQHPLPPLWSLLFDEAGPPNPIARLQEKPRQPVLYTRIHQRGVINTYDLTCLA